MKLLRLLPFALSLCCTNALVAQTSFVDAAGGEVFLPQGALSFADAVVARTVGSGKIVASAQSPEAALGPPNYSGNVDDGSFLSLGCDGTVDLLFADNALIDVPGPDLYVFEVGPRVEGTLLSISADGSNWVSVGEISGGQAAVDIAGAATPGTSYRYVRLVDDGEGCGSRFAGADIDAVAAIGTALRFTLDAAVLFDVDSATLRPEAAAAIDLIAAQIASAAAGSIEITGHTDATGAFEYNAGLSLRRAESVRSYLLRNPNLANVPMEVDGRGESEPVASNQTIEGRQLNRRVEIIVTPG